MIKLKPQKQSRLRHYGMVQYSKENYICELALFVQKLNVSDNHLNYYRVKLYLQQLIKMGNRPCDDCHELKNQNNAYGEFQLCHEDGKQMAVIEKKLENKKGLPQKIFNELGRRTKIKCKHIVRLHRFQVLPSTYEVRVMLYYEYMPRSLREVLQEYRLKQEEMGEKQLFGIIYGVQEGLKTLYEMRATHNCVNLDTILCKNGFYKVTDVSATTYLTSYQLVLQGNREQFLSQKLLNSLSCKMIKPIDASIDDDMFSLALIILMIVAKGRPENFYQWHKTEKVFIGEINFKHIEYCMRILVRNYSTKLVAKVKALLERGKAQTEEDEKETMTLTAQLQDLHEDMSRVMKKMRNVSQITSRQTSMKNTNFNTPLPTNK